MVKDQVTLNANPGRTVTIPRPPPTRTGRPAPITPACPPASTFNAGDTEVEQTFNFSADEDTIDDDGESVKLTFGNTLPDGA